jgi:hypothetical protein
MNTMCVILYAKSARPRGVLIEHGVRWYASGRTRDEVIYHATSCWPVPKFLPPIECPECQGQPYSEEFGLCGGCNGESVIRSYDETEVRE